MYYKLPIKFQLFKSSIIVIWLCLATHSTVNASQIKEDLYFQQVGNDSLIPGGIVTDIARKDGGYLWIGTQQGLVRYDGYNFQHYGHIDDDSTSIVDNNINNLMITNDERLWVSTLNQGISIYEPNQDHFIQFKPDQANKYSLALTQTRSLSSTGENSIYIGTENYLFHYDKSNNKILEVPFDSRAKQIKAPYKIYSLELDSKNNLWLVCDNGIYVLPAGKRQIVHASTFLDFSDELFKKETRALHVTEQGDIWIGSSTKGYAFYDLSEQVITKQKVATKKPFNVRAFTLISDDELWIGFHKTGIKRINLNSKKIIGAINNESSTIGNIKSNSIKKIMVDSSNTIWVATSGGGLYKHTPHSSFSTKYSGVSKIEKLDIRNAFETADKTIWLSTLHGLLTIDPTTGLLEHYQGNGNEEFDITDVSTKSVGQYDTNRLWVSTGSGFYNLSLVDSNMQRIDSRRRVIHDHIVTKEKIWMSGSNHLYSYNKKTKVNKKYSFIDNEGNEKSIGRIRKIIKDSSDRIWIAAIRGLFVLENDALSLKKVADINATLPIDGLLTLAIDQKNQLWISANQGLFSLNLNNWNSHNNTLVKAPLKVKRTTQKLFSNLQVDKQGRLWEATMMYDPNKQKTYEFGKAEGIDIGADWVRSTTKLADGRILFGGSKGLVITDPEKFSPWTYQAPLVVSNFQIDGKKHPVNSTSPIIIQPLSKGFSIEFSGLDFTGPHLIDYQYQLLGFDENWQSRNPKKRNVSYTNLSPGRYTFKAKATNRAGIWGEAVELLNIEILPKFYQTLWFRILMILLLALVIYLIFLWRVSAVKFRLKQESDKEVAQKKAQMMTELMEQKNQLLADVSHELRTPLTVLQLKVEALQHNLVKDVDASYDSLINKIGDINHLIGDIYQLAQSDIGALELNITANNCSSVAAEWSLELADMVQAKGFEWQQNIQLPEQLDTVFDKDKMKQVLFNLVSNSIAYTDLPGIIAIKCQISNDTIEIIIEDSSPGVKAEYLPQIFERLFRVESSRSRATGGSGLGLSICKSIIKAHGGIIESSASKFGGLAITISLPISSATNS